jgi:hypothetical protein
LDDRCILELCDPDGLPLAEAIQLARQVSAVESAMARQLSAFIDYLCPNTSRMDTYPDRRVVERSMDLLRAIADAKSFAAVCERLGRNNNPVVRALVRWFLAGAGRNDARRDAWKDARQV